MQWTADSKVRRWVETHPYLADVALKPYLFVINDMKNHTTVSALLDPHLIELVLKLGEGTFSAKTASKDLLALVPSDAIKVFEELRIRLLAQPDLVKKPDIFEGVTAFVETIPAFEARYLDLLEDLPMARIASWAVGGHDQAVRTETGKARLAAIIQKWGKSNNPRLSHFAAKSSTLKKGH